MLIYTPDWPCFYSPELTRSELRQGAPFAKIRRNTVDFILILSIRYRYLFAYYAKLEQVIFTVSDDCTGVSIISWENQPES
jgi:hypothetical protein